MRLFSFLKNSQAGIGGKKALLGWVIRYGAVIAVFLFIFIPMQIRLSSSVIELNSLRKDTEGLRKIMGSLLLPDEVKKVDEGLSRFESKFADAAMTSQIVDEITRAAEEHHMKMVEINSDSPSPIVDDTGKQLEVEGRKLNFLPISFRVETDYKELSNFLKALSDGSKWNMTVESLTLQKSSAESEKLQCDILLGYIAR